MSCYVDWKHDAEYEISYVPAGLLQVIQTSLINREEANGGSILRTHVCDCGSVSDTKFAHARPEELDELANDADLSEVLGDGEHNVGGGDMISWTSSYFITNNLIQMLLKWAIR